jgi:hypothetical protein
MTNRIWWSSGLNTLRDSWLFSLSAPPLAWQITGRAAGCEGFFIHLLAEAAAVFARRHQANAEERADQH